MRSKHSRRAYALSTPAIILIEQPRSTGWARRFTRKGNVDDAERHFSLALREAGYPRPRGRPARLLDIWRAFRLLPYAARRSALAIRVRRRLEARQAARNLLRHLQPAHGPGGSRNIVDYTHVLLQDGLLRETVEEGRSRRRGLFEVWPQLRTVLIRLVGEGLHPSPSSKAAHLAIGEPRCNTVTKPHVGCAHYYSVRLDEG